MAKKDIDANQERSFESIGDAQVIAIMTMARVNRFATQQDIKNAHKWLKSVGAKAILVDSAVRVHRFLFKAN